MPSDPLGTKAIPCRRFHLSSGTPAKHKGKGVPPNHPVMPPLLWPASRARTTTRLVPPVGTRPTPPGSRRPGSAAALHRPVVELGLGSWGVRCKWRCRQVRASCKRTTKGASGYRRNYTFQLISRANSTKRTIFVTGCCGCSHGQAFCGSTFLAKACFS